MTWFLYFFLTGIRGNVHSDLSGPPFLAREPVLQKTGEALRSPSLVTCRRSCFVVGFPAPPCFILQNLIKINSFGLGLERWRTLGKGKPTTYPTGLNSFLKIATGRSSWYGVMKSPFPSGICGQIKTLLCKNVRSIIYEIIFVSVIRL